MSSTNRGSKRKENDYYQTPKEAFDPIIPYLPKTQPIWEPAAGDGRLIQWMRDSGRDAWGVDLTHNFVAVDDKVTIRDERGKDFLTENGMWRCIVTNPPFSLAQEFCDHAITHADEVFMLLRLNYLGAQKRKDWWKAHEPDAIFVLSNRPDFTGEGGDSCEYGWFYWGFRYKGIIHP